MTPKTSAGGGVGEGPAARRVHDAIDLAVMAVSLAALVARTVALALTDLDRGLRDWQTTPVPDVLPAWVDEGSDL